MTSILIVHTKSYRGKRIIALEDRTTGCGAVWPARLIWIQEYRKFESCLPDHMVDHAIMVNMKTCLMCEESKSLDQFYADKRRKDKRGIYCKACWKVRYASSEDHVARARLATKRHWDAKSGTPEFKAQRRANQLKYLYGIDQDRYNAMLEEQNGLCAICSRNIRNTKVAHVDHNHACCPGYKSCGRCVRGLLCTTCNVSLGGFKDSISNLQNAIHYLERK